MFLVGLFFLKSPWESIFYISLCGVIGMIFQLVIYVTFKFFKFKINPLIPLWYKIIRNAFIIWFVFMLFSFTILWILM